MSCHQLLKPCFSSALGNTSRPFLSTFNKYQPSLTKSSPYTSTRCISHTIDFGKLGMIAEEMQREQMKRGKGPTVTINVEEMLGKVPKVNIPHSSFTIPRCLVQQKAPDFTAETVFGDNKIEKFTLSSLFGNKYICLFFYPLDFTFVCPSEIIAFDKKLQSFKERDCEVIGVSVDSQFSHYAWKSTPLNKGGIGDIKFPLVSDLSKTISKQYGVLVEDETVSLRGLFIIDKEGIVRHSLINDLPLGRDVDEALRVLDALQFMEANGEVCPANWKKGKHGMKATAEGVADYLSSSPN